MAMHALVFDDELLLASSISHMTFYVLMMLKDMAEPDLHCEVWSTC